MKRLPFFLFIFCLYTATAQQKLTSDKSFVVMSYNVENLYDTINDPNKDDEEFLPEEKNKWTSERYLKKLEQLSKVISTPNEKNLPAVIGFYEIENKKVLQGLSTNENLKKGKYSVVHYDSPDNRGIDVGMLYRKSKLRIAGSKALNVKLPEEPPYPTRDILMVKGISDKKDTLYFFFNHWPSRRSGADASEKNRMAAATVLRHAVDSIFNYSPNAKIIIMGDFNDYPTNKSICETLGADSVYAAEKTKSLFNLCYALEKKGEGSYNYKDDWGMLDQFIVSKGLLNAKKGLHVNNDAAKILKEKWMLYFAKEGADGKPNATYGGDKYFGGFSDHLPIYMELTK